MGVEGVHGTSENGAALSRGGARVDRSMLSPNAVVDQRHVAREIAARDSRGIPGTQPDYGSAGHFSSVADAHILPIMSLSVRVSLPGGLSPWRHVKGTGSCFRPTLFSPNTISCRKMDQSPTGPREGDRFMFSADVVLAKHDFLPKNGPVPNRPREGDRPMFSADVVLAKHDFLPKNGPVPNRTA